MIERQIASEAPPETARGPGGGPSRNRFRILVAGVVQGVGFRPFVYRLARDLALCGWVENSPEGVLIEVEGTDLKLEGFLRRIRDDKPASAVITGLQSVRVEGQGGNHFEIRPSARAGEKRALLLPDLATCADCLEEIFDPPSRRYRYPFTNCTSCGPRFTIVESLPYDRANTSMSRFAMCAPCRREYEDPADRRFHAQPIACPDCGPHLELWDAGGRRIASHHDALLQAADAIRSGRIVALKGLGGFQLLVDAANGPALLRLRERKQRGEKAFALMYSHLGHVRADCEVSELEEQLLLGPASPIVLLRRKPSGSGGGLSAGVAPGNPDLGVMLPYTPLHHLLMRELDFPLVATSGNRSQEPICTDEGEALERLGAVGDLFLVHDRPIFHPADDSVVRVLLGQPLMIRRARGYAPFPVGLERRGRPVLAVGAHLKNTVALVVGENVLVSPHVGDLETRPALGAFESSIAHLQRIYQVQPERIACDLHPDYLSGAWAKATGAKVISVQHHHAHVVSCMAEHGLHGTVLGVAWDGSGYGTDGTLWGGEFLRASEGTFDRAGFFRTFRLPGGERAMREPRRAAIGLLYEILGEALFERVDLLPVQAFSASELRVIRGMLAGKFQSPLTSGVGRLFDAIASLIGLSQQAGFEGQGAMALEFASRGVICEAHYPLPVGRGDRSASGFVVDWEPMVRLILEDLRSGAGAGSLSAMFHNALAESVVSAAREVGERRVVLSGGCFQNCYLTERTVGRLRAEGFDPFWHRQVPPNDGGISLGQAVVASHRAQERDACA